MKKQGTVPGILLTGIGLYFLLQQMNFQMFPGFYSWPTLLAIAGLALTVHAYSAGDHANILPGITLLGIGLHFHIIHYLAFWPDHLGAFMLILSLGFLLRYQKTRNGLFPGLLLLVISLFIIFNNQIMGKLLWLKQGMSLLWNFWPVLLIASGLYLLFIRKK